MRRISMLFILNIICFYEIYAIDSRVKKLLFGSFSVKMAVIGTILLGLGMLIFFAIRRKIFAKMRDKIKEMLKRKKEKKAQTNKKSGESLQSSETLMKSSENIPVTEKKVFVSRTEMQGNKKEIEYKIIIKGLSGEYKNKMFSYDNLTMIDGSIVFGRNSKVSNIIFLEDEKSLVSGKHCKIVYNNGFFIEDIGSTNGTYFENGEKLTPNRRYPLTENQVFYLVNKDNMFLVKSIIVN